MRFTLDSNKRLKSKKSIARLFESGRRVYKSPIRAIYFLDSSSTENGFQLGVSVPKRNFKKAVDRNLIKRRMREAFRLNQHLLKLTHRVDIMLIYSQNEILDYAQIEKSILKIIQILNSNESERIEEK